MAEEKEDKSSEPEGAESKDNTKRKEKITTWSIMAGIVLIFALAGFFLGKVLVETLKPEPIVAAQITGNSESQQEQDGQPKQPIVESTDTWFYKDLKAVVANLDEPGATRYVRTTLILEIHNSLEQKDGEVLLEEKTPHLRSWLTIYLASLSLDDAQGEKNLKRIQSDILESFNQKLFPNGQPQIRRILLSDFAIQ